MSSKSKGKNDRSPKPGYMPGGAASPSPRSPSPSLQPSPVEKRKGGSHESDASSTAAKYTSPQGPGGPPPGKKRHRRKRKTRSKASRAAQQRIPGLPRPQDARKHIINPQTGRFKSPSGSTYSRHSQKNSRYKPPSKHKHQKPHHAPVDKDNDPQIKEIKERTPPPETPQGPAKEVREGVVGVVHLPVKTVESRSTYAENSVKPIPRSEHNSKLHTHKLVKDGRRTPHHYRKHAMAASSPSHMDVKSITEYYNIPDNRFKTAEDVYTYRGYKKLTKIDEGAFGIVSKAVHLSDGLVVAVKEVDLRRKRAKRIEEMKRELFVLQKIDDKNIVKLVEHFIIGQMLVIIMEFCAGGNLTTYLKETAIDEPEAMLLFRQMASSIKVLHRKGIAHRDVKLNNFLLDHSRKLVKIGDFGLSVVSFKRHHGFRHAKTYCGTEPYMAPEILKRNSMGVRSYNPMYADIWSLGVCLFAMLTRTFPFKMQNSQEELFRSQVNRRWRFPRGVRESLSEEIKDLTWHMLDPSPERRITINNVVAHPWLNHMEMYAFSYDESDAEARA